MKILKIITILLILMANLYSKTLDKVTIQLDWLHQFQFAGYYIAKEKGFYENENLDVKIKEFDYNINILDDLLNKKIEYAVGKSSLIVDKLEGKDIVFLSAIYQNSPMVLISLKKSNIFSPKDLKNKKIMITTDAKLAASINSMIISQGVSLDNINFQKHSFKLEDLINGKTDAMASYLSNEPFILKEKNIDFVIHNPSDYGFDFYGGIFYTSKTELDQNPLRVKKVYNATLKGWKYAFENIEETAKLIFDKYNTQNKSLESLIYEGQILKKLAKYDEGLLGTFDKKKIEEIKRLYLLLGTTNKSYYLENFIYSPNQILKTKKVDNFLKENPLTLVTNNNYPPFTMMIDNKISGIEIDYWKLINKKLSTNTASTLIVHDIKEAISKIEKNPNHVKYSFSKHDKKSKLLETIPIAQLKIGIATKFNKPYISDLNEIKNKKIAIAKNALYYEQIKKLYPDIDFVKIDDLNKAIKYLNEDKVYAVIAKVPAIAYVISKKDYQKIKISGTVDIDFELKLVVNNGNKKLLKLLNESIALISDEERQEINNKYYSIVYQDQVDYTFILKFIFPLVLIIILLLIYSFRLKREMKKSS
ncbi:ABC transporter substrate-binding protein [Arcobacter arenosus]|uniref:Thiamine pyrimidine synthase n=1 Tax=Arcobacter arenosus TaxID=2576037 RepID=A0A5R8XX25_9BACT|nr:ABC transporter substrate-binding protein [Arcobacter arenosus]TLP35221.1 transporter substrate-binding domain-containing protein [Arcobacter arenosus]